MRKLEKVLPGLRRTFINIIDTLGVEKWTSFCFTHGLSGFVCVSTQLKPFSLSIRQLRLTVNRKKGIETVSGGGSCQVMALPGHRMAPPSLLPNDDHHVEEASPKLQDIYLNEQYMVVWRTLRA